jgi:ABC-type xylose transport system substrate-binding protein
MGTSTQSKSNGLVGLEVPALQADRFIPNGDAFTSAQPTVICALDIKTNGKDPVQNRGQIVSTPTFTTARFILAALDKVVYSLDAMQVNALAVRDERGAVTLPQVLQYLWLPVSTGSTDKTLYALNA